ncbi:MAG: hypothetical protein C4K49_00175 [Candidatus Thorarchaeota archaeon]|nr:MAG: hypothetical protein C4K49_00175 [Candidatus Thorarchaeota archaeon]
MVNVSVFCSAGLDEAKLSSLNIETRTYCLCHIWAQTVIDVPLDERGIAHASVTQEDQLMNEVHVDPIH